MFILLKVNFLYKNRLTRFIPEFIGFFAASGIRPVCFSLQDLKKILNNIYPDTKKQMKDFIIRPCPCRDAQGIYSKEVPNVTDILFTTNKKDYPVNRDNLFLTKKETFDRLDHFDKKGLVHIVLGCMGISGINICNCHKPICYVLQAVLVRGLKVGLRKGPSIATIDVDKCKGIDECGVCLERCVFRARNIIDGKGNVIAENCFGCGLCANSCPEGATVMKKRAHWHAYYFPKIWFE
jgi:ferredoxin